MQRPLKAVEEEQQQELNAKHRSGHLPAMPSCLRRRRASANRSCRTAGTEIWSDSVAKVDMLLLLAGGTVRPANPFPALPSRAFANESQWTDHCHYEQPHDVRSPSPVSERHGMACNRPAGTRAQEHIHPRIPRPRLPALFVLSCLPKGSSL
ncbi:hypothetical protein SVAN01_06766 [Stagonosporopsis vannaccii]|nr:hypothetical protein SVAN01_06766 [Stagonosporopsis vannaccii]